MAEQITITLPEELEAVLEQVVRATGEANETVLLDWLMHPVPSPDNENLDKLLEQMANYSRIQLWTVVYRQLPEKIETRHHAIVYKHETGQEINSQEQSDWDYSVQLSDIYMLLRSQALAILKQRGVNINIFIKRELG